ncbi:hypothetical protein [Rickettsia endosymbiont of Pantilius tunicatus]|uniref:hypothetical protein n=1 Tax=Rickettsia endosymbiont of Pantilius tunicatus TaxID=3066267 RepID=UPI0030E49EDA
MKTSPSPLIIVPQEELIYIAPPTPIDYNGNKIITPYAVTRIARDKKNTSSDVPMTPVTPMTPYTPFVKSNSFFNHKESKYFYNPAHALVRPIKDSAPEEAPPPIPVEFYDDITSTCALSLTGETIYAEPHIGG